MWNDQGRNRTVIEGVSPEIDGGLYPIKRVVGEKVEVEADIFADGHDAIDCLLLYRHADEQDWSEAPMTPLVNDRWRGDFTVQKLGRAYYTLTGWVDRFLSWTKDLKKRSPDDPDIEVNLQIGAELVRQAAKRGADQAAADWLNGQADFLVGPAPLPDRLTTALCEELARKMRPLADRRFATRYHRELAITVDPPKAGFSTWYELFPRSYAQQPEQHGTFADVEAQLPRISAMGFDVLYLAPIHPIGRAFRKGKNNNPQCQPDDVGSPWGIGATEGGHTAIHPQLGSLDDFHSLVRAAKGYDIDIALDIAYQCSPDHPWVKDHPNWFRRRPDGSIQYAENPPKKYQDIYPIDFETEDWQGLWQALADVIFYWIRHGVTIFRVDNPHTKAFPFWEWMIGEVKAKHPEVIFLSEAFTRPKVMYRLAKLGFTQSYTYFTWRNSKWELTDYFTELTRTEAVDFFRPNLWPNTPDILPEYLQHSGKPGFIARLVLAGTLGANYGMYGPAFELCVSEPVAPGKEEYLYSEKYQITNWTLGGPNDISEFITRVNHVRKANSALQSDRSLMFHPTDNPDIICYSKVDWEAGNRIVVVVNLDPKHTQSGWVNLSLDELHIDGTQPYEMHDMLSNSHYTWQGGWNFVMLNPFVLPAHIFQVRQGMPALP